jgi:cobalamin synthase
MRIAAVLAATLHNIHESARFKTGAFRFWGCLPVPESSAAEQKMQECLKVRLALEPLTCIRLAAAAAAAVAAAAAAVVVAVAAAVVVVAVVFFFF